MRAEVGCPPPVAAVDLPDRRPETWSCASVETVPGGDGTDWMPLAGRCTSPPVGAAAGAAYRALTCGGSREPVAACGAARRVLYACCCAGEPVGSAAAGEGLFSTGRGGGVVSVPGGRRADWMPLPGGGARPTV